MLVVISPAKTLDFETPCRAITHSTPLFMDEAAALVRILCGLSVEELGRLMKLSPRLVELNAARYRAWQQPFTAENTRPAIFAFKGDVYTGLDVDSLSTVDIDFAQNHLRILSGLYGLLRPLDLMQAYRLEMGTRLASPHGKNLYAFWGDRITAALNSALERQKSSTLINLASREYFKAVQAAALQARVITPVFRERRNGSYKVIGLFAKKARGMMARFIIREKLDTPTGLKAFDAGGYAYNPGLSTDSDWVFTRG